MRISTACVLGTVLGLAGCVEVPPREVQEQLRAGWDRPRAYAGADEVAIRLVRGKDDKLYLPAKLNGHDVQVALDTGSRTVFDLHAAQISGIASYATRESYYGFGGYLFVRAGLIHELDLGGLKVGQLWVVILDLTDLKTSQTMASLPVINGLIGADLLATLSARIDYDTLTLTLRKPPPAREAAPPSPLP
jgi:hypothetical protein